MAVKLQWKYYRYWTFQNIKKYIDTKHSFCTVVAKAVVPWFQLLTSEGPAITYTFINLVLKANSNRISGFHGLSRDQTNAKLKELRAGCLSRHLSPCTFLLLSHDSYPLGFLLFLVVSEIRNDNAPATVSFYENCIT